MEIVDMVTSHLRPGGSAHAQARQHTALLHRENRAIIRAAIQSRSFLQRSLPCLRPGTQ